MTYRDDVDTLYTRERPAAPAERGPDHAVVLAPPLT